MSAITLSETYREYIACLNRQEWQGLGKFVHNNVVYNGKRIALSGYRELLIQDFLAIPDLYFKIELIVEEPPRVASRLSFDCTPIGSLFDLAVNGKKVQFAENVFYEFVGNQIASVWSIIDKAAIASQL